MTCIPNHDFPHHQLISFRLQWLLVYQIWQKVCFQLSRQVKLIPKVCKDYLSSEMSSIVQFKYYESNIMIYTRLINHQEIQSSKKSLNDVKINNVSMLYDETKRFNNFDSNKQHNLIYHHININKANKINMKQLRETIIRDTDLIASKRRFGLFSQPPPLAVGDDSTFKSKKLNKGPDGKPITKPRNLLAGPVLTGVGKKGFIQVPQSIYQKDPYKNVFQIQTQYQNTMHKRSPIHETQFTPASGFKTIANASYIYTQQKQDNTKMIKRDPNGRVQTQPSNFLTNPISKVQSIYFKHLKHMPDPYSRKHEIEKQDVQMKKKKNIHEATFKSMSYGHRSFGKDKVQYGIDEKTKALMNKKKSITYVNANKFNHEARFKLAAKGHGDPIGRYPQYMPLKARSQTEASQSFKLKTEESERGDIEQWKPSSGNLTRPTPSISLMSKNMRKYV